MSLPAPGSRPGSGQAADEPLIAALVAERCPACGARLAPAAEWCSLCYADLRPAPVQAPAATLQPAPATGALPSTLLGMASSTVPASDPAAAGTPSGASVSPAGSQPGAAGATARPTWPCSSCGVSVDVDLDACPACGTGFLGALRSSSGGIELPVVGDLGRFSDRSRVVLGAVAGLVIAFILVVLTALLGH